MAVGIFTPLLLTIISCWMVGKCHQINNTECQLTAEQVQEIQKYSGVVQRIIEHVLRGPDKGQTYHQMAYFVDRFGARLAGSDALESSIDFLEQAMIQAGLERVRSEEVSVPHWVRGNESAWLIEPRRKRLPILGLGDTPSTPPEGITAQVIVVRNFEEFNQMHLQIAGKIVLFAYEFANYTYAYEFRTKGALLAAQFGAVAALINSATDFSIASPHTGMQTTATIPVACLALEDAQMLLRMSQRGDKLVIHLTMDDLILPNATSRNLIGEIVGQSIPNEMVIVGAHTDSWDVGQGAMDDAGGVFISLRAFAILRDLDLRPRRTLRTVLWTAEEVGLLGSKAYSQKHQDEQDILSIVLESDMGTFTPLGLKYSGRNHESRCLVQEVLNLFESLNATALTLVEDGNSDLVFWSKAEVPTAELMTDANKYFYFHHTDGDTMTVYDEQTLDLCTAFWTGVAYVFADLQEKLPR